MKRAVDSPAAQTLVATVQRVARLASARLLAVQRLGQRLRHGFQFRQVASREQISVRQAAALQAALQQLNDLLLFGKVGERHGRVIPNQLRQSQ